MNGPSAAAAPRAGELTSNATVSGPSQTGSGLVQNTVQDTVALENDGVAAQDKQDKEQQISYIQIS